MASDFDDLDKLFEMIKKDGDFKSAFLSTLNSMLKLVTADEDELLQLKQKYESWEELDEAAHIIDDAIERNELFQRYLGLAERVLKRAARAGLGSIL